MIVFGSGGETLNLGVIESKHCETCDKVQPFVVMVQYRYCGVYWIFNVVTERKYVIVCDACRRGVAITGKALAPCFRTARIPFMRRYGLATLMGAVLGVPLVFAVLGALFGSGH